MPHLVQRVLFASTHCLLDQSSGAALATMDMLQCVARWFSCRAFCAAKLDYGAVAFEQALADQQLPVQSHDFVIAHGSVRILHAIKGVFPVSVVSTSSTRIDHWAPGEPETMLAIFERIVGDFRPDVLLTYGGDLVTQAMSRFAKKCGMTVVFELHNFAYNEARVFQNVDYVIVPSKFSRAWYRKRLGLECHMLPYVIDWERVQVVQQGPSIDDQGPRRANGPFLTFVNPQPTKGLYVFARIAEQLQRRRPDIPILVVESRGAASWLEHTNLDLSWCSNLHAMANTHDPRDFYAVTKLLLVRSLWNESFGLVAAEAMINGIPVLASNRGALPEVVGTVGFLFNIPGQYTPETTNVPSVAEVEPWVQTIIRLWDDETLYRESSEKARAHAQQWHPDRLGPLYTDFFRNVRPRAGAPFIGRQPSARSSESESRGLETDVAYSRLTNPWLPGLTSIVLVTHNQLEYTRLCVDSIRQHTNQPYELIFIDNGSTDKSLEYLRSLGQSVNDRESAIGEPRRVTVIANKKNRGFPAAANQGIAAASGDRIVLHNNDTIVTAGWLTRLIRALHSGSQIGMAGPVSNFVSGPQCIAVPYGWEAGSREWATGTIDEFMARWGSAIHEFAAGWAEANEGRIVETQRLVGFCVLIRREVIDRIGPLDERFGIGNFEDDDYCRRAREAGFKLAIAADSFVHHFGGRTFLGAKVNHGELMRRNEQLYREKWNGRAVIDDRPSGIGVEQSTVSDQQFTSEFICNSSLPATSAISLCMIARDNERTIGPALETIRRYVNDIVVVDTGSTDRTPEIAASLGARVFHFPWCDDFSAARNESIRHALGEWIFWMDTDDTIDDENARKIPMLVRGNVPSNIMGFLMKVRCPASDGTPDSTEVDQVKLFRNLPELRFEGRIHEQILMAIRRAGGIVQRTDIFVVHSGADNSAEGRARKLERDLRILELEYQERTDHPFTLFNLGMTYEVAGEYEKAISFLWQSIGRAGSDDSHLRKAYALLASCYRHLGRHVTAWETCQQGLQRFPDDPELQYRNAGLLHEFGRRQEAADAYENLLNGHEQPHLSSVDRAITGYRARQNLAVVYIEMDEFTKAEEQWRRVIEEVPRYAPGWRGLVDALIRRGKFDVAMDLTKQMENDESLARDAQALRVETLAGRGDPSAALAELDAAVQEHPDDLAISERRCRLLFEHFPPADAEPAFRQFIERDPQNASAHHNLGSILYKLSRYEESADSFRESLKHRPDCASTYLHLGYALREAGKRDEALAAWEHALQLAAGDSLATAAIRELKADA